jgi:DNA replication protein DnaC
MGTKYHDASYEHFTKEQRKVLSSYVEKIDGAIARGYGLYLYGENDVGKSYVGAALCKYVWAHYRVKSYCVTAEELREAFINPCPAHEGSEEGMVERAEQVKFLVIDDLGKEHRSESSTFVEDKFSALIRSRTNAKSRTNEKKTTVVTTNFSPKKFKDVYGASLSKLLGEHSYKIHLKGPNMREILAKRIRHFIDTPKKRRDSHAENQI